MLKEVDGYSQSRHGYLVNKLEESVANSIRSTRSERSGLLNPYLTGGLAPYSCGSGYAG